MFIDLTLKIPTLEYMNVLVRKGNLRRTNGQKIGISQNQTYTYLQQQIMLAVVMAAARKDT